MTNRTRDRNFDSIAAKFQQNIYQTSKGRLREAVLQRDLAECPELQQPTQVLDIGAGQGQLSLWLAQQGHQVTLTDISAEMLAFATERAEQLGCQAQIRTQVAGLQEVVETMPAAPVVLCHAVLEWLAEPQAAIQQLFALTKPGGLLSLMFYNIDAKRLSNIIYGNFEYVQRDLVVKKKVNLSPQHPLDPQQVMRWCEQQGFELLQKTGVRCFHDYLRDRTLQDSAFEQLLMTELRFNRQEPYASLGRYQHLLLRRPS